MARLFACERFGLIDKREAMSHRNSYSVGSASAIYGFRSAAPTQPTRTSAAPIREGHSAEYEVQDSVRERPG